MGFSRNPFKAVTVSLAALAPSTKAILECDSCGAELPLPKGMGSTLTEVFAAQHDHVRRSHQRTPEDFKDWYQ